MHGPLTVKLRDVVGTTRLRGWTIRCSSTGRGTRTSNSSRPALGPIPPLFSGYRGPLPEVKRLEREVDHSPPPRAQNEWSCTSNSTRHFLFTFTIDDWRNRRFRCANALKTAHIRNQTLRLARRKWLLYEVRRINVNKLPHTCYKTKYGLKLSCTKYLYGRKRGVLMYRSVSQPWHLVLKQYWHTTTSIFILITSLFVPAGYCTTQTPCCTLQLWSHTSTNITPSGDTTHAINLYHLLLVEQFLFILRILSVHLHRILPWWRMKTSITEMYALLLETR